MFNVKSLPQKFFFQILKCYKINVKTTEYIKSVRHDEPIYRKTFDFHIKIYNIKGVKSKLIAFLQQP